MSRGGRVIAALVVVLVALVWIFAEFGAFETSEDLERRAAELDGGVLDDGTSEADSVDGGVADGSAEGDRHDGDEPSLAISGRATVALHDFSLNDKEGRNVIKARQITGTLQLGALKRGMYRMRNAKAEGVEVMLYRDASGKVSIVHALSVSPPTVRRGLQLPPKDEHEQGPWLMDIGPVQVDDATLTLAFTGKPVQFHIDSAEISVRRGPEDGGPVIYFENVQGIMTKPKPLPKPVQIAYAKGTVKLAGKPLVHLVARACAAGDEIRALAIVPERKTAVDMTVDSAGFFGALARMGLKIASRRKSEQLHYHHGAVKIDGGASCKYHNVAKSETARTERKEERREKRTEGEVASESSKATAGDRETRQEEREERREEKKEGKKQ